MATKEKNGIGEKIKRVLRPVIYRIPNSLRYGKYYRDFYKKIDNFYNLDINEKRKLQLKKLQEIVEYAYFHVPYYRELFDQNNISYKIDSFEDFEKIPYLTKDIIRKNLEKLKSDEKIGSVKLTTGGTTGMPMEFYLDKKVNINELAFVDYYWNKFSSEYRNNVKIVLIREVKPSNNQDIEKIGNRLVISSFNLFESNIDKYLNEIQKFNPDYLHVFPSSIYILANYIIKNNKKINLPNLKGIFTSSETLNNFQKLVIEEAFNTKICDLYGHTERVVIAFSNIYKKGYCLDLMYGYSEIIDDRNKNIILEYEKKGEIVATGFWNKSMPLIRYKTGDNVITNGKYDLLKTISGRKSEYLIDKNINKIPFTCSDEPFWDCKNKIEVYQYIQNKVGESTLKIVKSQNNILTIDDEKGIKKELERLYPNINFKIEYVDNIKRTNRGKYKYLIQNIDKI